MELKPMKIKIGINGFGRIGRLLLRTAYDWPDFDFVQINDPAGNAETLAHLMNFDSVHGRWHHEAISHAESICIGKNTIPCSQNLDIKATNWAQCDVVVDASGQAKNVRLLQAYLDQGVKRVVVTAPIHDDTVLNIVMGVNHTAYDKGQHQIVTAASCTTNCLAPIVKVIHEKLGIRHGSITTIHDLTNTQSILDSPHRDLRRARSCGTNLIPTTTGSATAITKIFPELAGRLDGHAVRVPLANASLTDCVFEVERATNATEVNALLKDAASGELGAILGFEQRPLVSSDYKTDPRSAVIDALSTLVINKTQVKLYAWYDNEWSYANRTAELVRMVGQADQVVAIGV